MKQVTDWQNLFYYLWQICPWLIHFSLRTRTNIIFFTHPFFYLYCFVTRNLFGPKQILDPQLFWVQNYSRPPPHLPQQTFWRVLGLLGSYSSLCEDCDHCSENFPTMEIHVGKHQSGKFECGLCKSKRSWSIESAHNKLSCLCVWWLLLQNNP